MHKGTSKLDAYIQTLLSSDEALEQFIKDPLVSENSHGLTKAERSVLRRSVVHLPPTAKSGFAAVRSLSSYRRSLRLLQNVIHNSTGAVQGDCLTATSEVASAGASEHASSNGGTFYMFVYYPQGSNNYTCQTNAAVDAHGGPYSRYRFFRIVFGAGYTTVGRLLLGAAQAFPNNISYQTVNNTQGESFVSEITIDGSSNSADLSNSCYDLSKNPNADFAFWFYSINGTPNHGGTNGMEGMSFENYYLNSGDTVFWQLIAPDQRYGFHKCV